MWFDGLQRVVYLLQEFQKDVVVDDPICCQVIIPRGGLSNPVSDFA